MLLWSLKQLPIGTVVGVAVLTGALQFAGIGLVGMSSDLLLDLLGVPDWSGDWFRSPL